MMLPKIDAWWVISIEAKPMAKIKPTYLLRSPVSIIRMRSSIVGMGASPRVPAPYSTGDRPAFAHSE